MASFGVLPHYRPAELSTLTAPAPWRSLLGNGLLNGALNHRSRQDGEDHSGNENQGHNCLPEGSLPRTVRSNTDGLFERRTGSEMLLV